jgi:proteasome alpha subunit
VNRNDQQAYDRGTSLYSPDGRIYQVEYAREAVKRGAASVGVRAADGVVLAALSRTGSDLMEVESVEKLHKLDDHVGAASAGHVADARRLIDFARRFTQQNRLRYDEPVGIETLAKRITDMVQESTQSGGVRPFGASLVVAGMDGDRPRLFETDPSGTPHEWRAVCIGGGRADVIEFLEGEWREDLTVADARGLAVRALARTDDEVDAESVGLAVVDADGYRRVPADEVAELVAEAGLDGDDEDGTGAE